MSHVSVIRWQVKVRIRGLHTKAKIFLSSRLLYENVHCITDTVSNCIMSWIFNIRCFLAPQIKNKKTNVPVTSCNGAAFSCYVQSVVKVEDNKLWDGWWWNDGVTLTNLPYVRLACSIHSSDFSCHFTQPFKLVSGNLILGLIYSYYMLLLLSQNEKKSCFGVVQWTTVRSNIQ